MEITAVYACEQSVGVHGQTLYLSKLKRFTVASN